MYSFTKLLLLFFICFACEATSQDSITVAAGPQYKKTALHCWLWGKNRRQEWTTSVRVPIVFLDTAFGGLTPYKKGGGNESKTLRLVSTSGKEYVLHSVNKSRDAVIPKLLKHSYFGMVIQDGVSMSYPYGALAVPMMMTHAGIYHTQPKLVYIPKQKTLDSFNTSFANDLYFLEERPDSDWSNAAPHLGNFKKFYSTKEVFEKMREDLLYKADQHAFIKSRLFDILIADWDRNHDNWRWGANENNLFLPISRDRDQAFFTRKSILMKLMMSLTGTSFMQNFDYSIKDVGKLTKQDRSLDDIFTNEMSLDDWLSAAKQLSLSLNDSVITASVLQLPPEIFALSGNELIEKLKSRRNNLSQYATNLYYVLAKHVKIYGTKHNDHIQAKQLPGGLVLLEVFSIENDQKAETPYYKRVFLPKETKQISVNGFGGNDVFDIDPAISIKIFTESKEVASKAFE